MPDAVRRRLLRYGAASLGLLATGKLLAACPSSGNASLRDHILPLKPSSVTGLHVPPGFTVRIVAQSGKSVGRSGYRWHAAPDGGAVFAAGDGGWIYVSNSEMAHGRGGASALHFAADGKIIDARRILGGTSNNCAGGPTPWQTWLSCEEIPGGRVWECDPFGRKTAVIRPALGRFKHEAAAVDPIRHQLYLTEDMPDGRLYRFTPARTENGIPSLDEGLLEVAVVDGDITGKVHWAALEDASGETLATRHQVPASRAFAGGEGIWCADGSVWFTTKHDNRVWRYDIGRQFLDLLYDDDCFDNATLSGVDNVTVSQQGTVYVAEDGGNMQVVAISPNQQVYPVVQLFGHDASEITGPAFDPSGTRLYFSSQRGSSGRSEDGVTYEIRGPFA